MFNYTPFQWSEFFKAKGYTESMIEDYLINYDDFDFYFNQIYGTQHNELYLRDFTEWDSEFLKDCFEKIIPSYYSENCDMFDLLDPLRRDKKLNWVDLTFCIDLGHFAKYWLWWTQSGLPFTFSNQFYKNKYHIRLTIGMESGIASNKCFAKALTEAMNQISSNTWDRLIHFVTLNLAL